MDRTQADERIASLGDAIGIPGLAPDEDGSCTIAFEEGVVVSLGYNAATGTIDLMSCVEPAQPSGPLLRRALEANFAWGTTGGATFAVEPAGGLVLQRRLTESEAAGEGLLSALEGLVTAVRTWGQKLVDGQRSRDEAIESEVSPIGRI